MPTDTRYFEAGTEIPASREFAMVRGETEHRFADSVPEVYISDWINIIDDPTTGTMRLDPADALLTEVLQATGLKLEQTLVVLWRPNPASDPLENARRGAIYRLVPNPKFHTDTDADDYEDVLHITDRGAAVHIGRRLRSFIEPGDPMKDLNNFIMAEYLHGLADNLSDVETDLKFSEGRHNLSPADDRLIKLNQAVNRIQRLAVYFADLADKDANPAATITWRKYGDSKD
jgi:hypothetical protein